MIFLLRILPWKEIADGICAVMSGWIPGKGKANCILLRENKREREVKRVWTPILAVLK